MASDTTTKMIKLQSSDGEVFEVPETVLTRQSQWIEDMKSKPEGISHPIVSVPVATAEVLKKVIAYCKKHSVAKAEEATKTESEKAQEGSSSTTLISDEELDNWDKQFMDVDAEMLYDLLITAKYMKIDGLRDLASKKVDDRRRWMFRQFSAFKIVVSSADQEE